jgi:hypothetical protein
VTSADVICKEGRKQTKRILTRFKTGHFQKTPPVRGFLGVCVYVRMFIFKISELALPLRKITIKSHRVDWEWGQEC